MAVVGYYFEEGYGTLCRDCAENWIKKEGIVTEEEIRYILEGPDYYTNNEMAYWPKRYKEDIFSDDGSLLHEAGHYVCDEQGDIMFDSDVKVTKQNRPSNFANVPNKDEVIAILDNDGSDNFDGETCEDCGEELLEPYYFDCETCHEHIAQGEEGWEYQKKIEQELEKKGITAYYDQYHYYICETCRTKQQEETYEAFYNGVNAIANKEGWGLSAKCSYMTTLIRNDTRLLTLRDHLLNDVHKAVKHGWEKGSYIIPRNYAQFQADRHAELLAMLDTHIKIEVDFDLTWNGIVRK